MLRIVFLVAAIAVVSLGLCQNLTPREKTLWEAMRQKDSAALSKILDGGYDLTKLTSTGGTPLHWAAGAWPPVPEYVIPLLLTHGARIEQADADGRTPLATAAQNFNVSATKLLIANHANIKAADKSGNHPIHYCVFWTQYDFVIGEREGNCAQIVRLLIAAGEDVNVRNAELKTPLILAAGYWHLPSVKALIELKADLDLVAKDGEKAITWPALNDPNGDICQTLLKAGANWAFSNTFPWATRIEHWRRCPRKTSIRFNTPMAARP